MQMENYIGEMIKTVAILYIVYVFILTFTITTFSYLTYRFWKMILPKEEKQIFISNAPMIGYKKD